MKVICNFCGNKKFQNKQIQYIYRRNGNLLIVNDVPCEECSYCGEQYFKSEILKKIERDYNRIYVSYAKPKRKVEVPVEEFAHLK